MHRDASGWRARRSSWATRARRSAAASASSPTTASAPALLPTRSVVENFSIAWNGRISNKGVLDTARASAAWSATRSRATASITASAASRDHDALGRQPAEGRARADLRARRRRARPLRADARRSTSAPRARSTGLMQEAAAQGAGIVLISSELPELLGIADRIVVFFGGEVRARVHAGRDAGGGPRPRGRHRRADRLRGSADQHGDVMSDHRPPSWRRRDDAATGPPGAGSRVARGVSGCRSVATRASSSRWWSWRST